MGKQLTMDRQRDHRHDEIDPELADNPDLVEDVGLSDEPDFAEEHTSATFADELSGGPEGITESESPEGYAGMESRGLSRRRRRDGT